MRHDKKFMELALELAKKQVGFTSPNPTVGAVIVKKSKVIAKANHKKAGLPHAEVRALKLAGNRAKGATLYVTLEPCVHFGKTPPCCDEIVRSGIKRVVVATKDPNPLNNGKGIKRLKRAGIKVTNNILEEEASYLNRAFFKFITRGLPYVVIKIAQSLDGKIATSSGSSKWITSRASRNYAQRLRRENDAILVGVNTILKDNPRLTLHLGRKKLLSKIVIDPNLKTPLKSKIFREAKMVLILTKKGHSRVKKKKYDKKTKIIEVASNRTGQLNLYQALRKIAKFNITSLLIEGGGATIANFIEAGLFDEVYIFVAPKIIGGKNAPTAVEGKGIRKIKEALCFRNFELDKVAEDLVLKLRAEDVYRTH